MRAIVRGNILLADLTKEEAQKIKRHLSLKNPAYHQRIRMNPRARAYLSPYVKYYKEKDEKIIVPRGCALWLHKNFKIDWEIQTHEAHESEFPEFKGTLRNYQEGIPEEATRHRSGLIVLPTGFGKTVIGLRIASLLRQRTLVCVPNRTILGQWEKDAHTFLGENWGDVLTVVTVQKILRDIRACRTDWLMEYGCVLYDEAQGAPAGRTKEIWQYIHAHYRYGLTGTPDRTDGQGEAIRFIFGPEIIRREMARAKPHIFLHHYEPASFEGEYPKMIEQLVLDERRNEMIADIVKSEKRKTIILTKRVEHYRRIADHLPDDWKIFMIESKLSVKKRSQVLEELRQNMGSYDVILGTMSLLGTGLDIPSLNSLVIAGDLKSHVLTRQAVGRIERLMDGKPDPIIHDIVDINNPILKRQAAFRRKLYEEHEWPIQLCTTFSQTSGSSSDEVLRTLFSGL